jgi:hypothetical protein
MPPTFFNLVELECFVRDSRTIDVGRATRSARGCHPCVRYDPFAGWRSPPRARRSRGETRLGSAFNSARRFGEGAVRPISYRSGKGPFSRQRGDRPKKASSVYVDRGSIDISCRCRATRVRRASRRPTSINSSKMSPLEDPRRSKTDEKCGKSIVRGGLGKDYARQKRKPSHKPYG